MATNDKNIKDEKNETNPKKKGGKNRSGKRPQASQNNQAATKGSALLNAAANLSFPVAAGNSVPVLSPESDGAITFRGISSINIPGVMRFGYLSVFGKMQEWIDAANVWIRAIYTYVRHANSGHANYDAASLGQYLLAYRSALDYLCWMIRLYGTVMGAYVPTNLYTPNTLVTAMKCDYPAIMRDAAKLRYFIISFASRLIQMKVPALDFFEQGRNLLSNIFMDCESLKSSFYLFDPDGFWFYHIGDTAEDTYLHVKPTTVDRDVDDIISYGEEMLNGLLNNEDFNIMSGDIMKAYTSYASVVIPTEDYLVQPVYDDVMLWIIHNLRPCTNHPTLVVDDLQRWKIFQVVDPSASGAVGALRSNFYLTRPKTTGGSNRAIGTWAHLTQGAIIDVPFEIPGPADIATVSRFIPVGKIANPGGDVIEIVSCESEIVTSACVFHNLRAESFADASPFSYDIAPIISRFDRAPMVYDFHASVNKDNKTDITLGNGIVMGEVTNFTYMPVDVKERIDHAIMLDMMNPGDVRGGNITGQK